MKSLTRNVIALLLVLALALCVPVAAECASAGTSNAVSYPLWVGGVQVTSSAHSGTGWSYSGDETGGTLTLSNATITGAYTKESGDSYNIYIGYPSGDDPFALTIQLEGRNTLSGALYGIYGTGRDIIITGSGSIDIKSQYIGICASSAAIENATVTVEGGEGIEMMKTISISNSYVKATSTGTTNGYGICSFGGYAVTITNSEVFAYGGHTGLFGGKMTFSSSDVTAEGYERALSASSVTLDGVSLTEPADGTIDDSFVWRLLDKDGNDAKRAVFKRDCAPPTIKTQPESLTVNEGKSASFSVTADGEELSYQWQYVKPGESAWQNVKNNGTSASLTLTAAARHNGYKYRCVVTNPGGSVTSEIAELTVNCKPAITSQPASVTVAEGKTATFKVAASDSDSYQWQYRKSAEGSWTKVKNNGATATYKLTAALRHNGYQYRCKVTNGAGSVYSSVVTLTVAAKPKITTQPTSVTVVKGQTATFRVAASGATSYQWYYRTSASADWVKVKSGGTSAEYSLTAAARHDGYQYRCKVTNEIGSVYSSTVTLTLLAKPKITTQPANTCVGPNYSARFSVVAEGDGLSYQWYYMKTGETTWNKVKRNGTSSTYVLEIAMNHNGYKYKCVVSNAAGSVESGVAKLTIG